MRYGVVIALFFSILLTGCEYIIPHTSDAISQSKQLQELQKQTKQIERQADAVERLTSAVEELTQPGLGND
ncbi:MAG: hypothetical protein MUF72_21370 [Elainella sp. Prado103]|jgi:hypothetical protein|nr:hypothetical protein [Elainella sp. Prado103]